jgi:hypothetical protein
MPESVPILFDRYLSEPSAENYMHLRAAVAISSDYEPYTNYKEQAYGLMEAGKFAEAVEYLIACMPNWFLNPGIHFLLSFIYHKLDQAEPSQAEMSMAMLFLEGILLTGDGSDEQPYLVLHTADEDDVLLHLNKEPKNQSLVEQRGKYFDRQLCADGSEVWFDVSTPYQYLQHQFKT